MKNSTYFALLLILSVSCRIMNTYSEEIVTLNQNEYTLKLPTGYDKFIFAANQRLGYRFIYKDSTTVYVNLDDCNPNNYRIKTLGDSVYYERFEMLDFSFLGEEHGVKDTIDLSGLDSTNGLFFRDLKINEVGYGYFNVKAEDKEVFDKIIDSKLKGA